MKNKRKTRHIISGYLVFLMAVSFAIIILYMIFYFGVFNQSILIRSFDRGKYYNEQCNIIEQNIRQYIETAGLPDDIFDPSVYRTSLERKMRSQVYGRHDEISELDKLNIAEDMLDRLSEEGAETTLRSEQGILRLSDKVGDIFAEGTTVPGIDEWQREKQLFGDNARIPLIVFVFLNLVLACILFLIQSRKYRFIIYFSMAVIISSFIGMAESILLLNFSKSVLSNINFELGNIALVVMEYQKEIIYTGLKINAGVLLTGVTLLLCGQIFKKSLEKD